MSHTHQDAARRPHLRELLLGVGLALLYLAYSASKVISQFDSGAFGATTDGGALGELLSAPVVTTELIRFGAAQVGLYTALGVLLWLLSVVTVHADLLPRARPWQLIVAWFIVGTIWLGLANAYFYPWSVSGSSMLLIEPVPGISTFAVASVLLAAVVVGICTLAIARSTRRGLILRCVVWGSVGLLVLTVLSKLSHSFAENTASDSRSPPNIIVIGIDSLRSDLVGGTGGSWLTPNIDAFVRDSNVFADTTTPLGRTFPAWVSILTGNHPQTTGARENLMSKDSLRITPTIADRLRSLGYRTEFATDEVRFSNIDRSFGFDAALTPTIGAADFLLGTANDLPLSNLIVNTRLGAHLFPASYANRGAAVTYRPETFIERLESEAGFRAPFFLAVHLTLPHWPFRWADGKSSVFEQSEAQPYAYLSAVVGVDRQFRQLMTLLEERGVLDNAIVVLLSDHGEGLGLPQDSLVASPEARQAVGPLRIAMWGHGTSVLSPHQNGVLLAFRGYGRSQLPRAARDVMDVPATLEDIAPTVLDLVGDLQSGDRFDGQSLAAVLRNDVAARETLAGRFRFLETAYNPPALARDKIDEKELVAAGRHLYAVNPSNARIEFRMDRWPDLLSTKERAVIQGDWLLAALPAEDGRVHRYLLVDRRGGLPRWIEGVPDAKTDPTVAALWQALHARFPGELHDPAS